jgi:tetratricopeptide (TPR) repeat protein
MLRRFGFLLLLLPVISGCLPADGPVDDEKDPHFQQGRNLVNSEDFKGATEEFELALQTNPNSAAAHFELGWLSEKAGDYAAAIYHYERHLKLQPDSPHAATIQERIRGCKQELANSEFPLPNSQNLQKEVDRLTSENTLLHQQIDSLQTQLAAKPAVIVSQPQPQQTLQPSPPSRATPVQSQPIQSNHTTVTSPHEAPQSLPSARDAHPKTYVIKEHDTIRAISLRLGLKPNALQAANPKVDPRKLRVGQTLNLP